MDVDSWTKWTLASFFRGTFHNLFNGEIPLLRMFAVQQRGCDPDLIGSFNLKSRRDWHACLLMMNLYSA